MKDKVEDKVLMAEEVVLDGYGVEFPERVQQLHCRAVLDHLQYSQVEITVVFPSQLQPEPEKKTHPAGWYGSKGSGV
jgi:hypothetical protein